MKVGDRAIVSPDLTGLDDWKEGTVIEIENNHFNGIVISIKIDDGCIFFGPKKYFKSLQEEPCMQ